jgi:hypothetical protein
LSASEYQVFFNNVAAQGYKPVVVCGYGDSVHDRYADISTK